MDKVEIVMFLGLSGFILFLFFYMLKRDRLIDSKLAAMELALEDLNQEVYKLKKNANGKETAKMIEEMQSLIDKIIENVKKMESKNLALIKHVEEKIISLESSVKSKIVDYTNINKTDEQRILNLYKSGYSIEEISRELRIPAGEVELVIKFQGF